MKNTVNQQFNRQLNHLYVSPLEKCNLRCKICYTRKTNSILREKEIFKFVEKYQEKHQLDSITFCGGEVFSLSYFTGLVNKLTAKGIFIQIITNGTIDKLDKLSQPNSINLIVSIDGLENYHDQNRGKDNFSKSINFLKKAQKLGFHSEVFSILTKQNYKQIEDFEKNIEILLVRKIPITYHPRKSHSYLKTHPFSNIRGTVKGFDFLNSKEMVYLLKNKKTFPPKNLGCFQISLMSDGKVYGCCEGTIPIGTIGSDIEELFSNLKKRLENWEKFYSRKKSLGCSQPDFVCGIKDY